MALAFSDFKIDLSSLTASLIRANIFSKLRVIDNSCFLKKSTDDLTPALTWEKYVAVMIQQQQFCTFQKANL